MQYAKNNYSYQVEKQFYHMHYVRVLTVSDIEKRSVVTELSILLTFHLSSMPIWRQWKALRVQRSFFCDGSLSKHSSDLYRMNGMGVFTVIVNAGALRR